jgi:hypothetical protein
VTLWVDKLSDGSYMIRTPDHLDTAYVLPDGAIRIVHGGKRWPDSLKSESTCNADGSGSSSTFMGTALSGLALTDPDEG